MYITRLEVIPNSKANQTVSVILYEREGILTTTGGVYLPRRILWGVSEIQGSIEKEFKSHIKIKGLTDVWFRAKGTGSDNQIEVELDFYLVDADDDGA